MSEDEPCPLCLEDLDATDRATNLCACGYSICLWCFHRIMEDAAKEHLPARCPNCRSIYDTNTITMQKLSEQELEESTKKQRRKGDKKGGSGGGSSSSSAVPRKPELNSVRVVQRNLVYVVGLAMDICYEDVLRGSEFFGQFGKPIKVSVNRSMPPSVSGAKSGPSGSAYVTFRRPQDAQQCIETIDGATWRGRMVRACFGTTKYCNAFLKGVPCNNTDCLYLHAVAEDADSFTKEQMLSGDAAMQFVSLTHPPANKPRAGVATPSVHSATATSSVSQPIAPPAPAQGAAGLQRSVTLPISRPAAGAATADAAAAVSTLQSAGSTSWARVSAGGPSQPASPAAQPPPPPPRKAPADQEWPTLSGGPGAAACDAVAPAASDVQAPAAAIAAGGTAGGETMAAQLARTQSAPLGQGAAGMARSPSAKKLAAAASANQRTWAAGKTLVPPPPPPGVSSAGASSAAAGGKSPDAASQQLTLPLPSKRSEARLAAAAAATKALDGGPVAGADEEQVAAGSPLQQQASAEVTDAPAPAPAPEPAVVPASQPEPQGARDRPLTAPGSAAVPAAAASRPAPRKAPPPGFEVPLAAGPRSSSPLISPPVQPPPGFGGSPVAGLMQAAAVQQQQQQQQQQSWQQGAGLFTGGLPSFPVAPEGVSTAGRRQSRFSFARAEAEAAAAADAAAQQQQQQQQQHAQADSTLLAALQGMAGGTHGGFGDPFWQQQQQQQQQQHGPPPVPAVRAEGYGTMPNGLDAAVGHGFGGAPGAGLQPGAALLRQLQAATLMGGGHGAAHPTHNGSARATLNDPAIMAARITRSSNGPPPGFGGAALGAIGPPRGAPPGFSFPVGAATEAGPAANPQPPQQQAPPQPKAALGSPAREHGKAGNGNAVTASPRTSRGGKKQRGGRSRAKASGGD